MKSVIFKKYGCKVIKKKKKKKKKEQALECCEIYTHMLLFRSRATQLEKENIVK